MRRRVKVAIYNGKGEEASCLSLDTTKYDAIGFTLQSLTDYVNNILIGPKWLEEGYFFSVQSDKITRK